MKTFLGINCEHVTKGLLDDFEGIGLVRSEYLCRLKNQYITKQECQEFIFNYVSNLCSLDENKMIWYRFTDLTTNEINTLDGCDLNIYEKYHFMGTKGVRRHLLNEDIFIQEAKILKNIGDSFSNIGVVIPYISSVKEFLRIKEILNQIGYNGKIGIMIEVPIVLFQIDEFIKQNIDCFIVGMNDLTTLLLSGVRESAYHNKVDLNIIKIISKIKRKVELNNKEFMIAGYFKKEDLDVLDKIKNLKVIINYSNLPIIDDKYHFLEDIDLLKKVKKMTKENRDKLEVK
jgi:phosphoenolpyruvate-protein kinase (PTS system EI component)